MPNWCATSYVMEGKEEELDKLCDIMGKLENLPKPLVENGFGNTWLGCLVKELGGDWNEIYCRGSWENLRMEDGVLKFETETAWTPMHDTIKFILEKFPSIRCYYSADELGVGLFETNDRMGKHFNGRYVIDISTPDGDCFWEYYDTWEEVCAYLSEVSGRKIRVMKDVEALDHNWRGKDGDCYCCVYEVAVTNRFQK